MAKGGRMGVEENSLLFCPFVEEKKKQNKIQFSLPSFFSVCMWLQEGSVQGRNQFPKVFRTKRLRGLDFSFAKAATANGYLYKELGQT